MKTAVLKTFWVTVLLLISSSLLFVNLTFASPLPPAIGFIAQAPVASPSPAVSPAPTTTSPNVPQSNQPRPNGNPQPTPTSQPGVEPNRDQMSRSQANNGRSQLAQPAPPENPDAFDAFNRALYGS